MFETGFWIGFWFTGVCLVIGSIGPGFFRKKNELKTLKKRLKTLTYLYVRLEEEMIILGFIVGYFVGCIVWGVVASFIEVWTRGNGR